VGRGDVLDARGEDVEHEPAAREQQVVYGSQRAQPRFVVQQVQVRAKRTGDERHPLLDRRDLQLAEPQVESVRDSRELRALLADLEHPG